MLDVTLVSENDYYIPDANKLVTEDDTPVDNFASEKQQRFLVNALYSSQAGQIFLAATNVGIFHTANQPAIVPDVFVSLQVQVPENWWEKSNRSYMIWHFGKPPEVVIEIVSNKVGNELGEKLHIYEQMRASYYIVYDPNQQLGESVLRIYELRGMRYLETTQTWLEQVELGLTLWEGEFEGRQDVWLRWCDAEGNILLTGDERATKAEIRANTAEERAQILAAQLRALGVEPDTL
ncbi:MAG: Uma2 family endonuclease [Gomphosphaeria aponina SAG 52.96 = DSM 107014]|uniref:Uma2 family endonuclease n=1 Tax=Gomphosphaeria aponina SAG 52.96 = DSM 107014 TaxID=1521640 RepID=A0A941GWL9_9CHRO|nr:Uma2 family endonuclease [Gomphosphaeria aponina SAG 52.96 = DSM 107014]